jgi:alkyl hydroperoxide reductase subunit AhpC
MGLQIGDIAPDFTAETTEGTIRFHDWLGNHWGILFSHPADYTPVCTTELGAVARLKPEFDARRVKVIGLSVDPLHSHYEWIRDINETQRTVVSFPIISDVDRRIADLYGMLYGVSLRKTSNNSTIRSAFIIAQDKTIRLILSYPESTGRNFDEILRAIDSLQLADRHGVVTPANWKKGDDCLIPPQITAPELRRRFPQGYIEIKPYLRYTPQPSGSRR